MDNSSKFQEELHIKIIVTLSMLACMFDIVAIAKSKIKYLANLIRTFEKWIVFHYLCKVLGVVDNVMTPHFKRNFHQLLNYCFVRMCFGVLRF